MVELHGGVTCLEEKAHTGVLIKKQECILVRSILTICNLVCHCQCPDISVSGMRPAVLEYIRQVTELGKIICDALSMSLGLDQHFLRDNYLQPEPVTFFRAWRYALGAEVLEGKAWRIGEHSGE
jgi:isopenicillin N synthase-like dioxygenase